MDIFAPHLQSAAITIGIMGAVFGLLALLVKRRRIFASIHAARREFLTNAWLTCLNLVILAPLFALPEEAVRAALGVNATLADLWDGMPSALVVLLAIALMDLVVYWRHRMEHHPLLWPIHATHHADTAMHWLTVMRKHPLSKLLSVCVDLLLVLYMGVPAWAVAAASFIRSSWAFFIHCDVPWTLGIFGHVLISPAAHRLHHIRDERYMGRNYGNTLAIWDQVFGTYLDPAPFRNCETGIAEGTRGFFGELGRPFERRYWARGKGRAAEETFAESEVAA